MISYVEDGYVTDNYIETKELYAEYGYVKSGYTQENVSDENALISTIELNVQPLSPFIKTSASLTVDNISFSISPNTHNIYSRTKLDVETNEINIIPYTCEIRTNASIPVDILSLKFIVDGIQSNLYVADGYVADGYVGINPNVTLYPQPIELNVLPLQPIFNNEQITLSESISLPIQINNATIKIFSSNEIYIAKNNLSITLNTPKIKSDLLIVSGTEKIITQIKADTIYLSLKNLYLNSFKNCYIYSDVIDLDIISAQQPLRVKISPDTIDMVLSSNSAVAQQNYRRRVKKIGDIEFENALYFDNLKVKKFNASTLLTTQNDTVLYLQKLGKFSKSVVIGSDELLTLDTIQAIQEIITEDEVDVVFDDEYTTKMKFDLLNTPLSITQIFEGSTYYNVQIKGLI